MTLDRLDLADIDAPRILARQIHKQFGRIDAAVPVIDIARSLDIQDVKLGVFDGFEGMLLTNVARSTGAILANTAKGERRARFTVAHELGHFLLERHVLSDAWGFRCKSNDMRETREMRREFRQEAEANHFAIELLAPRYLVSDLLAKDLDLRNAQRVTDLLDISLEASVRRMLDLRPEPLAAVWSYGGRIRYFVKTPAFPFLTREAKAPLPPLSASARAVSNGKQGFTELQETHSIVWTSQPDLDLYEQTRVSNTGHAITLLWADLPDDENDTDGSRPELGMPAFR